MKGQGPDPVDVYVGDRMRYRRKTLRMSQEALGVALGVAFQQVQKYERGSNRVSASVLVRAARALAVPFGYFVDGAPGGGGVETVPDAGHAERTRRMYAAVELVPEVLLIPDLARKGRRAVGQVIDALSTEPDERELEADHAEFRENVSSQLQA